MSNGLSLAGARVVIIDDSNTIRRSGEIFLSQAGCRVMQAEDGVDGLAKVAEFRPDVILLDITMPRLDGYQTCALLKHHPVYAATPVVMLTSRDDLLDRAHGKLLGIGSCLVKPFSKRALLEAVAAQLPGAGHG